VNLFKLLESNLHVRFSKILMLNSHFFRYQILKIVKKGNNVTRVTSKIKFIDLVKKHKKAERMSDEGNLKNVKKDSSEI